VASPDVVGNFKMKLTNQIDIDILDFFKTGKFDYLKLGHSKEWILNNFPDPDDFGMGENLMTAEIWFYGNIELLFDKNELFLIHTENIKDLDGGQFLNLEKWILEEPNKLTLSYFIKNLNIQRVDFSKKTEKLDSEYIRLHISGSNVTLTFLDEENTVIDPNEFMLSAFSLTR
jgi:hypothetical protein